MTIAAAVNENVAHISNYLIYSAIAVYTLAFLAYRFIPAAVLVAVPCRRALRPRAP